MSDEVETDSNMDSVIIDVLGDEALPSPQPQYRSYFEVHDDQVAHELPLRPVKEERLAITFKLPAKYLKWTIPTPSGVKSADYNIILGISAEDMNLDAVEAIVITIFHNIGDSPAGKSEVITSEELRRLCLAAGNSEATNIASDDKCFRWKLHEKLILPAQKEEEKRDDKSTMIVLEVKTWLGEPADYGSIELHYVEIISDLEALDEGDPMYREHKPFIHTVDLNRSGYPQLDKITDGPMRITDYTISRDGSRILVIAVPGDIQFLQLWDFRSQPQLVAWMQLSMVNKPRYDYCLSLNGSQLACIDLSGHDGGSNRQKTNSTVFYKVDINHTTAPVKAVAGSGFVSFTPDEKTCPKLGNLSAKAAFNTVYNKRQNTKNELFVTCDGITVEVYGTVGSWKHIRSIVIDPARNAPIDVCNVLRNNLRGYYLAMRDLDTHQVSTWHINQGIRLSSCKNLTYEQMENVNDCAAVSKDGSRIAIPGKYRVDIFLTATWTLLVSYPFQGMEHSPSVRSVQFLYNEEIMVALHSQQLPFHQQNRGLVLGANRVSMVEEYITEGCDTFRTTFDTPTRPQAICIGDSQVSFFILEDRAVLSLKGLKKRCGDSCHSIESFPSEGCPEPTTYSDLRFKVEYSTAPAGIHGRHEDLPVLVVTCMDGNDQQRLSISLPKVLGYKDATLVNGNSHLLMSFNELVMVWSAPISPQDTFTLQLVHAVPRLTDWKVCPHRQLYGLRSEEQTVSDGINLNDPIQFTEDNFMAGIAQLPLIFSNSNDVVQQEIIHYIVNLEAFKLAEVFIDYCVHQAKLEKDPVFQLPVLQCLQELVDPKRPYSETALKLLRDLAYLPARNPEAIISRHWIAHPFEIRWRFWRPNPRGLDQHKDQVLSRKYASTTNRPENSFSRGIYLASFDMLWLGFDGDQDLLKKIENAESTVGKIISDGGRIISRSVILAEGTVLDHFVLNIFILFCSVICIIIYIVVFIILVILYGSSKILIVMLMRRFGIVLLPRVECHHFELKALDNPAIAALVEYKWNRFVLWYWLLRFLAQCVYYALVLVVIFMQIHRYDDEPIMKSIFTAIAGIAGWFLWLELMQIINYKHGYFRSVYNYVDLLAFLTPFTTSIWQLNSSNLNAQNSLLSFSTLFIFLHLSGRYDPVSNGLSNDDAAIHVMLMMFFFFTVIVMMNVLIALINHAFDDGDKTWELDWLQNRMRFVESAENMNYVLGGCLGLPNYYPQAIYYTATALQVREYKKTTQKLKEENSPTVGVVDDATEKSQKAFSKIYGGYGQISQQQQQQEQEEVDPNVGDSGTMMEMLKQLQKEQIETRLEQQATRKALLAALEEQQREGKELRNELARLKGTAAALEKFIGKDG
ncbi:hypothetical protein BGZ72_002924 [Mortierella alpina]|nr:hypothetical protein BGZ72_002924 [Mortierella alpina]